MIARHGYLSAVLWLACGGGGAISPAAPPEPPQEVPELIPATTLTAAWAPLVEPGVPHVRLSERFSPPAGFQRVEVSPDSFGAFLRELPLRTDRVEVRSYRGERLSSPAEALVLIDVGAKDLQQCADAVIRLHAEYLWASGRADLAAYHFTSGDRSRWRDWQRGERFRVKGSKVERVMGAARAGDHATYRQWLDHTFVYAGSRSLARDSSPVPPGEVQPGDFYVIGGSPGHAVIVLDVAVDERGRRAALIGQSFMPAQDIHVLRGRHARVLDRVWFLLPDEEEPTLNTPSWAPFHRDHARRFNAG